MDKAPQQDPISEKLVLGAIMAKPGVLEEVMEEVKLTPEMFYFDAHKTIFNAILKCNSKGACDLLTIIQYLTDTGKLEEAGGVIPLTKLVQFCSMNGELIYHAKVINERFIKRQASIIFAKASEKCKGLDDIGEVITDVNETITLLMPKIKNDYENSRIDPLCELTEPPVYCSITGSPSMTAGNFSLINGKVKSGKTFLLGSIVASMLNNSCQLSVLSGSLPKDKQNILYFDTEQSTYHASRTIRRICTLIDKLTPPNLLAYSLRPFTPAERLAFIEDKISKTPHLGVVAIDGIRDLLTFGINDEQEATTITSKFLKWTADFNIHLIILLHQNKTDLNARGHIGTEVLNKAETTLTVTKDKSDIFIVSCEYSRDISFNDFGFTIVDGCIKGSNLPTEEKAITRSPRQVNDQKYFEILDSIYKKKLKLNYTDLQDAIIYAFDNSFGRNLCRNFITHYLKEDWIIKAQDKHKVFYVYNRATF